MGLKSVVLVLALIGCLASSAVAAIPPGPKNMENDTFPLEGMSGNEIYTEVREGVPTDVANESVLSFRNESLFYIRKDTGTSLPVQKGVRTPVVVVRGLGPAPAAGTWSFTLTDVVTRYLTLNLVQYGDAVTGNGQLNENGVATPVTVGGTAFADRLALFVTPIGGQSVFRLSLTIKPGSMDGDYILSGQGIQQPGIAFGSFVAPQTTTAATTQQGQYTATQQTQQQAGTQTNPQGY